MAFRMNQCVIQSPGLPNHADESAFERLNLRSNEEIPLKYRSIFKDTPYFNIVQSTVLDDVLYTDNPLVVCAPTGSGKTMLFELAIVRMLLKCDEYSLSYREQKIVYMAPIKALCAQRHSEWSSKFESVDLKCSQLTGDSNTDEFTELQRTNIIFTTPEKWDSTTRRWHNNVALISQIRLFLIDEVHLLNDEARGATMEAVISRMKTKHAYLTMKTGSINQQKLRFVAVSATIPNVVDIADWLGTKDYPTAHYSLSEDLRPVKLNLVVLGYPCYTDSEFKFDVSLNYKLSSVIESYSENQPTLVFCSTRKSVEQAAARLSGVSNFVVSEMHQALLSQIANLVRCHKLRTYLMRGVGYHHAGLDLHDRELIEKGFVQGHILVLLSTSTLAMGVNLPAHLVIIKSTSHYVGGICEEYSQSEIMQMIGRAGRPQFDVTATAVIMTKQQNRSRLENITNGTKQIESSLHKHLIEHLNAEIVLGTIPDTSFAFEWIRSTFLYIRTLRNPSHYGYPKGLSTAEIEDHLQKLCIGNVKTLGSDKLVNVNESYQPNVLQPTLTGRLMAQYCIAFETMKEFPKFQAANSIQELIGLLANCKEFQDISLRVSEKTVLNNLNKSKTSLTIRYPMDGRIKTVQMKVNCLLQAVLGNLPLQDFTLQQDITKIFRTAARVSRCFMELQLQCSTFSSLLNAAKFAQCIKARIWDNSPYVCRQLPGIGPVLATALANGGIRQFEDVMKRNPRELELIVNRHPPFGNQIQEAVKHLPRYAVSLVQCGTRSYGMTVFIARVALQNHFDLRRKQTIFGRHTSLLVIGDSDDKVLFKRKICDSDLLQSEWSTRIEVKNMTRDLVINLVLCSQEYVGLDAQCSYLQSNLNCESSVVLYKTPAANKPAFDSDDTSVYFSGNKKNVNDTLFGSSDRFNNLSNQNAEKNLTSVNQPIRRKTPKSVLKQANLNAYSSTNMSNWMNQFSYRPKKEELSPAIQCLWSNEPEFIESDQDSQDADSAIAMYLDAEGGTSDACTDSRNALPNNSPHPNTRKADFFNTDMPVRKRLHFDDSRNQENVNPINDFQPDFDLDWDDCDRVEPRSTSVLQKSDTSLDEVIVIDDKEGIPSTSGFSYVSGDTQSRSHSLKQTPDDTPIINKNTEIKNSYASSPFVLNERRNTVSYKVPYRSTENVACSSYKRFYESNYCSPKIDEIKKAKPQDTVRIQFDPDYKKSQQHKSFVRDIFSSKTENRISLSDNIPERSMKAATKADLDKAQQMYFKILDSFDL